MFRPWRRYFDFRGRAPRREYWLWQLFCLLSLFVPLLLLGMLVNGLGEAHVATDICVLAMQFYWLALIIPSLSVAVRRLHDSDMAGWWMLILIVPFGVLVLLIFCLLRGTEGMNAHGPDPRPRRQLDDIFA